MQIIAPITVATIGVVKLNEFSSGPGDWETDGEAEVVTETEVDDVTDGVPDVDGVVDGVLDTDDETEAEDVPDEVELALIEEELDGEIVRVRVGVADLELPCDGVIDGVPLILVEDEGVADTDGEALILEEGEVETLAEGTA